MLHCLSLLVFVAFALCPEHAHAATVSGRVVLDGAAPQRPTIMMSADPACDKLYPRGRPAEQLIADSNGSLANAIVHVSAGLPKDYEPAPVLTTATIDQKGCAYVPHVIAVRVGEEIQFRNSDATIHNVNSRSVANLPFNEAMPAQNQTILKVFSHPELAVKLKCDIHPWMSAYVGVFAHPFFAVTGSDGRFALSGLPEGDYTIEAWHEALGQRSAKVSVDDQDAATVDFSFVGN